MDYVVTIRAERLREVLTSMTDLDDENIDAVMDGVRGADQRHEVSGDKTPAAPRVEFSGSLQNSFYNRNQGD